MVGNATEEWLMTRLDYPGHADPARIGGLAGSATSIVAGLGLYGVAGPVAGVVGGLIAGGAVGGLLARYMARNIRARRSAAMIAQRHEHLHEQERQIEAMKQGAR